MRAQLVGGDDAEVGAGAAQPPEQVAVLVLGGPHQPAVRGDDVGGDQVVAGQAVHGGQPAVAAAEAEAAHAGGGDPAAGGGPPGQRDVPVVLAPQRAALRDGGAPLRVGAHALHRGEVDQDPAVDQRRAGDAVAAAAHRQRQPGSRA